MYASKQLALYESWIANKQKTFTLRMTSLRSSAIDLHTDGSNRNFRSVEDNVSNMRQKNVFGMIFLPLLQNNSSVIKEISPLQFYLTYSIN